MLNQKNKRFNDIADVLGYLQEVKTELLARELDATLPVENIAIQALSRQEVVDLIDRMITDIKQ